MAPDGVVKITLIEIALEILITVWFILVDQFIILELRVKSEDSGSPIGE